jgi:hypothetical protein
MRGYDWGFGFGFGRRHPAHRSGYDDDMRGAGYRRPGLFPGRRGYDRQIYGEDYPVFGGGPGDREEGMYYGRPRGRYAWNYESRQGFGARRADRGRGDYDRHASYAAGQRAGGYARDFAREPFLPNYVYARHPELEREPHSIRMGDRPTARHPGAYRWQPDDHEIEQAVRENLYQDSWIDADNIDIEVRDGVVKLSGEVDDFLQSRYAWDDAWETDGVRGVLNQLVVRTDRPSGEAHGTRGSSMTEAQQRS